MTKEKLPPAQAKNFRALVKVQRELAGLKQKRRAVMERIFDEIEKNPSLYQHEIQRGRKRELVPMTPALAKKLRKKFLQQQQQQGPKNPNGGPGCSDCEDIDGCWCAFKAGPLCCYLCASIKVIRCYF